MFAGENLPLVEYSGRGTHEGTLRRSAGDMPPTGRPVGMRFCDVQRIGYDKMSRACSASIRPVCWSNWA